MLIGRVIGDLTATQKHATHEGKKILLVQPLELDGSDRGTPLAALDSVNAGMGDRVLVTTDGYAAFTALGFKQAPMDAAVVGVIDHVELVSGAVGGTVAAPLAGAAPKKQKKQHRDQHKQ